jgi:hypothetical protein
MHVALLEELGYRAFHVRDGDAAGLTADLLILYGNCRTFHRYERLLRRSQDRPKAAIWQVDPLPPIEFDRRLEKIALAWASIFTRSRLARPLELLTTIPLFMVIARTGFAQYSDRANVNSVDLLMARTVVEAYGYINRGVRAGWLDQICVSTVGKQKFLATRDIASVFAPAGAHSRSGDNRNQPRDIDVLFLGRLNKRNRRRKLEAAKEELERRGLKLVVVSGGCYGEERTALLNRTKIVLNLNKYPWDTPWMRWIMSVQCGCLMVSEPLSVPEPFVPGVHYVEAALEALPDTVQRLVAEPDRIRRMADECAAFIQKNMLTRDSLERIVTTSLSPATGG